MKWFLKKRTSYQLSAISVQFPIPDDLLMAEC